MQNFNHDRIKKLLNKLKGPTSSCSDEIEVVPSPDRTHALVFSHGLEMTMMNWSYNFTLLDKNLDVVEKFERMTAVSMSCSWSGDSSIFAVPGCAWGGLLLWNVRRKAFTIIRISGRQFIFKFQEPSHLLIQIDPEQLRAMNNEAVFGGGSTQCPAERFRAPADSRIALSKLRWHSRGKLSGIERIAKKASVIDMDFVADGFFPFKGKFPASTTDVFNGRRLEVFQLEAFAAYGDKQAQAWLTEIKKNVGNHPDRWAQARWSRVSKYLGSKKRNIPPGVT
jgi:hypothetical protein